MSELIFGANAIETAMEGGRLKRILHAADTGRIRRLLGRARDLGIPCEPSSRRQLEKLCPGRNSQGVAGEVAAFPYADLAQVLGNEGPVLALDGVEDVGNLGAIIRSAYALGAAGLIIPKDNAASVTPQAERASAGAASKLPIARVVNLGRALDQAKQEGRWVYGAIMEGDVALDQLDLDEPCVLILGGEGAGIRKNIARRCDQHFHIPMARDFESLNVSVSAAIALYVWSRRG